MTEQEFSEQALDLLYDQLLLLSQYSKEIKANKGSAEHNRAIAQTMLSIVLFAVDELSKIANMEA